MDTEVYNDVAYKNQGKLLNTFLANGPFLYFLKSSKNQRFCNAFRRYRKGALTIS